jgi:hypothetical protein
VVRAMTPAAAQSRLAVEGIHVPGDGTLDREIRPAI